MANKRFYEDLRRKAKQANQRMVRLEQGGIQSPAYQAAQAKLEMLGKTTKGSRGRRFSETGKATYNEMQILNRALDDFLSKDVTSTVSGAKRYYEEVWNTANENYDLDEAGISKEEWLNFWDSMSDKKDRLYGSEQIIAMVRAYSMKDNDLIPDDKLSMSEIADKIESQKTLKGAYNALGLTGSEVRAARIHIDD